MGGFLAIVMSHFIPIKTVIAFAPQYSVDPADVPWETRWKKYTCDIPEYRVKNAASHMNAQTSYFLFTSDTLLDKQQAELFPVGENLLHYNFCQRQSKSGPKGSVKCYHFGVVIITA